MVALLVNGPNRSEAMELLKARRLIEWNRVPYFFDNTGMGVDVYWVKLILALMPIAGFVSAPTGCVAVPIHQAHQLGTAGLPV